jgi:hypothetical protein
LATSRAVVPWGTSLVLPSGSLMWMRLDMDRLCILLNLLSLKEGTGRVKQTQANQSLHEAGGYSKRVYKFTAVRGT